VYSSWRSREVEWSFGENTLVPGRKFRVKLRNNAGSNELLGAAALVHAALSDSR
jgi:hypothetical protein